MSEICVKLVPDKDVQNVILPQFISCDERFLTLSSQDIDFDYDEMFDAIIEEGNRLKFIRASFQEISDGNAVFNIETSRDVIKREYERVSMSVNVQGDGFEAQSLNISAGGMQIKTKQNLPENKVYNIKIKYPTKEVLAKYEVLRVKPDKKKFLISGKFVELDKETRAFIIQQNLINKIFGIKSSPLGQISGGSND